MNVNKLIRPPKTNIFFGSEGNANDFRNEDNTVVSTKDEILNFTNSGIYKDGLAIYRNFSNNGAVLSTMNSQYYIDSHRTAYLYQQGIPEFDKDQNYYHGSLFMLGSVIMVVIGSDTSYSTKVDFSTTPALSDPNGNTVLGDKYAQTLVNNTGWNEFRTKCLPLHLYQEGISRPVISGLNLVSLYPTFFTNSDGANVTTYNLARQDFITNNLSFLKSGTTYKSFNVPQGFGLVNNHNSMGVTTGGGDGAGISAVDNHMFNHVASINPQMIDIGLGTDIELPTRQSRDEVFAAEGITLVYKGFTKPRLYISAGAGGTSSVAIEGTPLRKLAQNDLGHINKAWFDLHPNTGAGLQLGYYTLLKQL